MKRRFVSLIFLLAISIGIGIVSDNSSAYADTSISIQVNASNDDAWEYSNNTGFTSTSVYIRLISAGSGSTYGGLVFDNVTIPQGAVITAATLDYYIFDTYNDMDLYIYANDVDNANNFSTEADVTSRTKTSHKETEYHYDIPIGWQKSLDFSDVIEEVTDRAGWVSGNSLCVLLVGGTGWSSSARIMSYDNVSSQAARLNISYTLPSVPTITTNSATSVTTVGATLNGYVTNDGGKSCSVWFQYYNSSCGSPPANTSTQTGKTTGTSFSQSVPSGLTSGCKYSYMAWGNNSGGYDNGSILSFLTLPAAPSNVGFVNVDDSTVNISWTKGTGADYTMVRYKYGGYPANISDGFLLCNTSDSSYLHTDRVCFNTTYYSLYSYAVEGELGSWNTVPTQVTDCCDCGDILVDTLDASTINTSSAKLNGNFSLFGCSDATNYYKFYWGEDATYGNVTTLTARTSAVTTFNSTIVSLSAGKHYHYLAYGNNSYGSDNGSDMTFITLPEIPTGTTFSAYNETTINISWTKGSGADYTMVRRGTSTYPVNTSDGTEVYNGSDSSCADAGLSEATFYYYSFFSYAEDGGLTSWSSSYATGVGLTAGSGYLLLCPILAEAQLLIPYDDISWVGVTSVYSNDSTYASITSTSFDSPKYSYFIHTHYDINLPSANVTINGINVSIEKRYANGMVVDGGVFLTKDGTNTSGDDKKMAENYSTSVDQIYYYGNSTDLWGTTWTSDEVSATEFGVLFSAQATGTDSDVYIDYICINISFTATGTEVGSVLAISNTPSTKDFNFVDPSTSYWSKGSTPSFPLDDAECYFTITNDGDTASMTISATNFSGGVGWVLSSTAGADIVVLKAGISGDANEGAMVTLNDSEQAFISGLAESATKKWELKLETGTFSDGELKTGTITITATLD